MKATCPRIGRVFLIGVSLIASLILSRTASAGSGTINFTSKTIDITLNCRFAATAPQLTELQDKLTQMSHVLWDATEGQLRLGNVTITCNEATLDAADYWVYVNKIRSSTPTGLNLGVSGQSSGTLGAHTKQAYDRVGGVYAHEFGHLGFSLRDEYGESQTTCGGMGPCMDAPTEQNQCLMQQSAGLTWSEFCVSTNHDPKRGNNPDCHVKPANADGAPCADKCDEWDVTTLKYERSRQQRINGKSCWQSLTSTFSALTAPALPVVAEPGAFTAPTFNVNCATNTTFVLVLDRSGSMIWSVKKDKGEVCGNGIDDDGDGMTDETSDCAQSRMEYVKESAAAILELANDSGISAGIVGFDEFASTVAPIQSIDANLANLEAASDGISPGGQTAIGRGLDQGKVLLDADPTAPGAKAAMVITDGHNNRGPSPATSADAYKTAGYRVYTVATGEASNDALINDIAENTNGYSINEPEADELVTAVAEMYTQYRNGGVLVPRTPYIIDASSSASGTLVPHVGFPQQFFKNDFSPPGEARIQFNVEPGTRRFTALLAGNLGDMSGFGVDASLIAPDGTVLSAAAPPVGVRVVFRRFFTFVRVQAPMAGLWTLAIRTKAGAASTQTGTMIVVSEHPESHLFVNLSRNVVTAPGQSVNVTVLPGYVSGLRDADVKAWLRAPDGTITAVSIATGEDTREVYTATLSTFPMHGAYDLVVDMSSTAATTNEPGENHPGEIDGPALTVPIPPLQRSITRTIYVDYGPWVCPPSQDCDGDGITGESTTSDGDGDHVPASHDPDDNSDNVPDGKQPGSNGHNPFDGGIARHRRWWFGGAVGSSHPLGDLNEVADANIYGKIDLAVPINSAFVARLAAGFAQFTAQSAAGIPHPYYTHLSANVQWLAPLGPASRFFVNAGPGWYRSESNATSGGFNVGLGWQIDATAGNVIELGTDYHRVSDDRGRFITWHLGILFR